MWESRWLCPHIPVRDSNVVLIIVMGLLATSDQVPGTVPGPYMYFSFNLNNPVRKMLLYYYPCLIDGETEAQRGNDIS